MLLRTLMISTLLTSSWTIALAEPLVFGKLSKEQAAAKNLKELIEQYRDGQASDVLVKGTVKKVCEQKGCWMTLDDQGQSVRVFFKGYGFFVNKKLLDKQVIAEGKLVKKLRTVAEQKHLAKDAGESQASIDAIKADQSFFEFEAAGVKTL